MPTPFFNPRSFKYGAGAGTVGVLIGGGLSVTFAYYFSFKCMGILDYLISVLEKTVKISDATVGVVIGNSTKEFSVSIEGDIPSDYTQILEHADTQYGNCFSIPLITCLVLTVFTSLSMAAAGCVVGAQAQKKAEEEAISDYVLMGISTNV